MQAPRHSRIDLVGNMPAFPRSVQTSSRMGDSVPANPRCNSAASNTASPSEMYLVRIVDHLP
jgi:hypothetical protein